MTLREITDKADLAIEPLVLRIQAMQDDWILTHRSYWQGIMTPIQIPRDGADEVCQRGVKPVTDDEAAAWNEVNVGLPLTLPCTVEVFNHNSPFGKGWSVIALVTSGADVVKRTWGFGRGHLGDNPWQLMDLRGHA